MTFQARKAVKRQIRLRLGFVGPAGSGKTYTSLLVARVLGGRTALIDTEHLSSEKYADQFEFDIVPFEKPFSPARAIEAILYCEKQGFDNIIFDSLSHIWAGVGGALEMVDNIKARSKSGNSYVAWRDVTPQHNQLIDTILGVKAHFIGCMRSKTEYVQEKDDHGKTIIRKVGIAPIQREGMDYEFDIVFDLDWDNRAIVSKTRCFPLRQGVFTPLDERVSQIIKDWLAAGEEPPLDIPTPEPVRTQSELITMAKEAYGLDAKGVGAALKAQGITAFDPERWNEMLEALGAYKAQVEMSPVAGD